MARFHLQAILRNATSARSGLQPCWPSGNPPECHLASFRAAAVLALPAVQARQAEQAACTAGRAKEGHQTTKPFPAEHCDGPMGGNEAF